MLALISAGGKAKAPGSPAVPIPPRPSLQNKQTKPVSPGGHLALGAPAQTV